MSRIVPFVLIAVFVTAARAEESGPTAASHDATPGQTSSRTWTAPQRLTGTVIETVNAAGYTYVHFDSGKEKIWAAAPEFVAEVGETVTVFAPMPMRAYHSRTLDRTFELVYFASRVEVEGAERGLEEARSGKPSRMRAGRGAAAEAAELDLSGIEKAAGGKTVEELYAGKADLAGQEVLVRGRVVKFLSGIMGKNWLHLRDGTGAPGSDDLTVTTDAMVETGDKVLVRGKVAADRDFGFGYEYELIIEDAEVTVE